MTIRAPNSSTVIRRTWQARRPAATRQEMAVSGETITLPDSLDLVRRRPELIPYAIEEVLRMQSAVQFFPSRSATADIEVGGTVIPKARRCT